ncbi:hypothetical protein KI387_029654 [Taxus chinensis]|uniref:Uncharacterized protein n=1 Tax=Taxus chinensis TaxID=29808 RepID=A0AA38FDU2_TAXCH|nr:hypothetical protein KI387_029654 [Taxus chinensis]
MQNVAELRDEMGMEMSDEVGYPTAYAKLCNNRTGTHIDIQMPYSKGPPYTYLPYALHPHQVKKLKELNQLFPVTLPVELHADPPHTEKYIDVLWKKLDHLGNAGFDPAQFRIDPYGNVLYFHADPASPLSWEVDHWFPRSRGGKTVPSNLRPVQWQVKQVKQNKLEFLVPWWDLQLGISVNQFLSVFASNNADFRQRAFSYMFFSGKSEQLHEVMVVECHSWPQHFLHKKRQLGLAPAAIVRVQKDKDMDGILETLNMNRSIKTVEEGATSCKEILKLKPSYSKENRETERSFNAQNKDKQYCLEEGDWEGKANMVDFNKSKIVFSRAMQKELSLKLKGEEEIRKKQGEICQLDQELKELQMTNEAERLALEDLEFVLIKQRRRTEKQRRLAETQASYKQCMEKMIRDTMHQNVVYKEQTRLNQAACNALMARLESLKADSGMSERELWKKYKQREDIQGLLRPYSEQVRKRVREDDTASWLKKNVKKEVCNLHPSAIPDKESAPPLLKHAEALEETTFLLKNMEENSKRVQKELRQFLEEDQEAENGRVEEEKRGMLYEAKEDELDDALEQVLAMQHEGNAEEEEQRVRRAGKANLDKWLQMLLQNTADGLDPSQTLHCTRVDAGLNRLPLKATVAEHRKTSSDAQLHNEGFQTKVEKQRDPNHLLQSKGKEECKLKRNASARRPFSSSLWRA